MLYHLVVYTNKGNQDFWVVADCMSQAILQTEEQVRKLDLSFGVESAILVAPKEGVELIVVDHAAV